MPLKKKKEKKVIVFNPADYDYLHDPEMPLEGWVWEFERRSDAYKKTHKSRNRAYAERHCLIFPDALGWADPSKKWSEVDRITAYLSKADPVRVVNMKWGHVIPSEDSEPFTYEDTQFIKAEADKVAVTYSSRHSHPLDTLRHEMGKESVVMALINVTANNKDITFILENKLDKWRKALNISPDRSAKKSEGTSIWKAYLMVYDIIEGNDRPSYREVGEELRRCFEDRSYDDRNIANYYKKAIALINGGYKALLPTVK